MEIADTDGIARLIEADTWRMEILRAVASLGLPDWAIGAGFVRAAVWDALTDKPEATPLPDIDVIYFDPDNTGPERDLRLLSALTEALPDVPWDLKNQARMHKRNADTPTAIRKTPWLIGWRRRPVLLHG